MLLTTRHCTSCCPPSLFLHICSTWGYLWRLFSLQSMQLWGFLIRLLLFWSHSLPLFTWVPFEVLPFKPKHPSTPKHTKLPEGPLSPMWNHLPCKISFALFCCQVTISPWEWSPQWPWMCSQHPSLYLYHHQLMASLYFQAFMNFLQCHLSRLGVLLLLSCFLLYLLFFLLFWFLSILIIHENIFQYVWKLPWVLAEKNRI